MASIEVPKPVMTDLSKINIATEAAFNSLVDQANKLGLQPNPVAGLMYLPHQETTRQFQEACRAVLADLGVTQQCPD